MAGGDGFDRLRRDRRRPVRHRPRSGKVDRIEDFAPGRDQIGLDHSLFSEIRVGELAPAKFHIGAQATTIHQHIIYNAASGALYYDHDGKGGDALLLVAHLSPHLNMHAGDFLASMFLT